ncbi:hypothetical protein CDAR_181031 [Caerostris darwini]|uniref:Uncharacterized protein n=1 Tax=Caerostris darwini TaxID=1538125 RepID=A0AAV4U3Z2_9ARAC|nr:hypothetical protein CDAR_181031 [Caerostris darwini]
MTESRSHASLTLTSEDSKLIITGHGTLAAYQAKLFNKEEAHVGKLWKIELNLIFHCERRQDILPLKLPFPEPSATFGKQICKIRNGSYYEKEIGGDSPRTSVGPRAVVWRPPSPIDQSPLSRTAPHVEGERRAGLPLVGGARGTTPAFLPAVGRRAIAISLQSLSAAE